MKNKKETCDWLGCKNKAYREVYPCLIDEGEGWSYLCRKHYNQEQERLKGKLPSCGVE